MESRPALYYRRGHRQLGAKYLSCLAPRSPGGQNGPRTYPLPRAATCWQPFCHSCPTPLWRWMAEGRSSRSTSAPKPFVYAASELEGTSGSAAPPRQARRIFCSPSREADGCGPTLLCQEKDGSEFPVDISLALIGPEDALSWLWRRCGTKAIESRSGGGGAVVRGSRVLGRQFFFMSAVAL